jgi:hypothetical protein
MLNAKTFALLKKVIATIPHDNRRAFRESDLILGLVENLPVLFPDQDADDLGMWTRIAKAIVKEAMDDEGTPAAGMLHLPGFDPYPYLPDQLLSDGKGYLTRHDDAWPEFTRHAAELAEAEARIAEAEARRIARIVNEQGFLSDTLQWPVKGTR